MTGTTRASGGHDSDEEMEAGDSPSPLPVRDSKAVSPEDDGLKDGRKDTFYTEGARGGAAKVALLCRAKWTLLKLAEPRTCTA